MDEIVKAEDSSIKESDEWSNRPNVWVFKAPNLKEQVDFVYASLKKGISRYGWSYIDCNLIKLREKGWDKLNDGEKICYGRTQFLLKIKKGDWIVHVNVPKFGLCNAGIVENIYKWDEEPNKIGSDYSSGNGDFRHTIELNINSIVEFDRNDANITPFISRRLKLQGGWWRIYETEQFIQSINNLKENKVSIESNVEHGLYYLREDIKPNLCSIANSIHKNHPGKRLEELIHLIFKKVPNVVDVKMNGSGFGPDFGADLIITYSIGLPISGLQEKKILVVQIKSFSGVHYESKAVDQIKIAITKYVADAGLIISTASASEELIKKIDEAQEELEIPIGLMCNEEVATFILKYGSEYLF